MVDEAAAARASVAGLAARASAPGLAAMLRVQVRGCGGILPGGQQICVPCPTSAKQVWDAVETALGKRRVQFDLLVGHDHLPYSDKMRWWTEGELDVTAVMRPPDLVAELIFADLSHRKGQPLVTIHSLDFLKAAVSYFSGSILAHASPRLQGSQEAVLFSVRNCGSALKFASSELRDDRDVVKAAVQSWGGALAYASERLKDDTDLVHLAINDDSMHGQWGTQRAQSQLLAQGRIMRTVATPTMAHGHLSELRASGRHQMPEPPRLATNARASAPGP